jgi:hypothetical protein
MTPTTSPLSHLSGTWKVDQQLVSTVTVKHRSGPVTYVARAAVDLGVVRVTPGHVQADLVLDPDSIVTAGNRDPRWHAYAQLLREAGSVVQFESSRVSAVAPEVTRVTGRLRVGRRRLAVSFELRTTEREDALEVVTRLTVAHRKLGLHWLPAGPLKAPTELVLRARLVSVARTSAHTVAPARGGLDRRYRFMANGS